MTGPAAIASTLAVLVVALFATRRLGTRLGIHPEAQRKAIHVGLGLFALTFPLIFSEPWQVITLCALAVLLLVGVRLVRVFYANIGSALHGVERDSFGDLLFAFSIALLFFLSEGQHVLYVLPLLILALCDAFAALVGVAYGRISFVVEKGKKSLEGSVMFFLTAWILTMICLLLLTNIPRDEVAIASLIIAVVGTLLEGLSWRGLDNLLIPFGLFLLTQRLLASSLSELISIMAVFVAVLAAATWLSARAAQHVHAVITVVTAVFFCWIVDGWGTVPAPALVFTGYLILRSRREYAADGSELPIAFCIISTAFAWYVLNRTLGIGTYYAFNLSFGLHLTALIMLRETRPSLARWTVAVLAGWAVASIGLLFVPEWHGTVLYGASLGFLIVTSLATVAARDWLLSYRWAKQAVLVVLATLPAMAVPQ